MLHSKNQDSRYWDLPESFHQQSHALNALCRSVEQSKYQSPIQTHFVRTSYLCLIYWPSIYMDFRYMRYLAARVKCPKPPEGTKTFRRFLRQHVEDLLGPLQLPVDEDIMRFNYANQQGYTPQDAAYSSFVDPVNYTAFQPIKTSLGAALRTRIVPLYSPLAWRRELPESIALLYRAWEVLVSRNAVNLFTVETHGLAYLPSGYLFIDWEVFLRTDASRTQGKDIPAADVCNGLEHLPRINLKRALIPREVRASAHRKYRNKPYNNAYQKAIFEVGLDPDKTSFTKYCTIIDPVALHRKPKLFEGRVYYQRRQRKARSLKRTKQIYATGQLDKIRTAKLYTFEFCPATHLTKPKAVVEALPDCQWFDSRWVESVYAIRRKNALYFARPLHLSTRNPACAADVQVWLRALDALKMVPTEDDTGDLAGAEPIPKSQYFKRVAADFRRRAAELFIEDFAKREHTFKYNGKPSISEREWTRATQQYAEQQRRENADVFDTTVRAGHWYNRMVAKVAREFVNPNSVRRSAFVRLPGQDEPATVYFYSITAIDSFAMFAEASFRIIPPKYKDTPFENVLKGNEPIIPAPYILAWARLCREIGIKDRNGQLSIQTMDTNRWTPEEDLVLFQHYTTRPRMSDAQWDYLLKQLPKRNKQTCRVRAAYCNRILKKILTTRRLEIHRVGNRACTLTEAKRTLLLFGCARAWCRRGQMLNKHVTFVQRIFNMFDTDVLCFSVPLRYDKLSFAPFLDDPA